MDGAPTPRPAPAGDIVPAPARPDPGAAPRPASDPAATPHRVRVVDLATFARDAYAASARCR